MSEVVLYRFSGDADVPSISPLCSKVWLALQLLDLEHRVETVRSPIELRRVSPTGRLPVVHVGRDRVAESARILDVLERLAGRELSPAAPALRARDLAWESFTGEAMHWAGLYLRWLVPENRARMSAAIYGGGLRRRVMDPVLYARVRARCRAHGIGLRSPEEVRAEFLLQLDTANAGLEGGPFLGGRDAPGRGDLGLAAVTVNIGWRGVTPRETEELLGRPHLVEHLRQVYAVCGATPPAWLP